MQNVSIVCDVCGKTKGESNRWFQMLALEGGLTQINFTKASFGKISDEALPLDICGEACLMIAISENIKKLQEAKII